MKKLWQDICVDLLLTTSPATREGHPRHAKGHHPRPPAQEADLRPLPHSPGQRALHPRKEGKCLVVRSVWDSGSCVRRRRLVRLRDRPVLAWIVPSVHREKSKKCFAQVPESRIGIRAAPYRGLLVHVRSGRCCPRSRFPQKLQMAAGVRAGFGTTHHHPEFCRQHTRGFSGLPSTCVLMQ
jgi:hypothetical protein